MTAGLTSRGAVLLGQQVPQYQTAPPCWSNAAGEVADLMSSLGRPADPWQRLIWELWLGERPDGTWAAFECYEFVQRQDGKGLPLEGRGLGGLFLFGEELIIYTAHKSETVVNTWKRVRELVEGSGDLTRRVKRISNKDGEEGIELMSGAEFQFRVRSGRGKGRGLSAPVLMLDEALYLTAADIDGFGPTMLAMPNAQVVYASTPPEHGEAHIVSVRDRGRAGEARLAGAEWSNEPDANIDDPQVLAAVNPAYGTRITPERMADMRKLLGEDGFRRECGGIWPTPGMPRWQVIPKQRWKDAEDVGAQPSGRIALGVKVLPDRSSAAICAAAARVGGGRMVDVFERRPGVRWLLGVLPELDAEYDPLCIVIDDRAVVDELGVAEEAEQAGLVVHRATVADVVASTGMFYDGIAGQDPAGRDVRHKGRAELTDAAEGAARRPVGGLWVWGSQNVSVDSSSLGGVSLALWGLATPRVWRPERAPEPEIFF